MAFPFATAWGPTTQVVGDGILKDILFVTQCSDTTPVILREVEKSTTDHATYVALTQMMDNRRVRWWRGVVQGVPLEWWRTDVWSPDPVVVRLTDSLKVAVIFGDCVPHYKLQLWPAKRFDNNLWSFC